MRQRAPAARILRGLHRQPSAGNVGVSGVLVVRPSSLGDVVHALPIVADIAEHAPHLAVDWIAEEAFASLVAMHPGIRRVFPVGLRRWRRHLLEREAWREFAAFRAGVRKQHYAAVLDLQEQMKGAMMARLARGVRHGFDRDSVREPMSTFLHDVHHAVPRTLHFGNRCRLLAGQALGYAYQGLPHYGLLPPLPPRGVLPAEPFAICVHATSRQDKLWPEPHWHQLLAALESSGLKVLLPWGTAAERRRSESIARGHEGALVPSHHPLPSIAGLLRAAEIVVGVDTGLVHLAAALGTPAVALFTVTDPALAGVAIAGAHAVDLGGRGDVPTPASALEVIGRLLRLAPRG